MQGRIDTVEDDFWTERRELFPARFPTYSAKPEKVWGRFHTSEERYESSRHEIIPISEKKGKRTTLYTKAWSCRLLAPLHGMACHPYLEIVDFPTTGR